jgi:Predicted oxidoreductases (related to aryl-alcohol dehydrogenases)
VIDKYHMATKRGTWDYREQFGEEFGRTYFRRFDPGVTSSIGIGTYLGAPTDSADEQYYRALVDAIESGVNHLDTAINYRCQRSERIVGDAIADAAIDRDAIVLATKGGFIPFDEEKPADPGGYISEEFIQNGAVDAAALARGCHALTPAFIDSMLDQSQTNLAVDYIDCYYIHNPETQLTVRSRTAVYDQLTAAFEHLSAVVWLEILVAMVSQVGTPSASLQVTTHICHCHALLHVPRQLLIPLESMIADSWRFNSRSTFKWQMHSPQQHILTQSVWMMRPCRKIPSV